jgi:hypothetical protein
MKKCPKLITRNIERVSISDRYRLSALISQQKREVVMLDKHKTKVIFRKFSDGDIIALFPEIVANARGDCESYMHIGQHSGADYFHIISTTELATPEEYEGLRAELTDYVGYNLEVVKRRGRSVGNYFQQELRNLWANI